MTPTQLKLLKIIYQHIENDGYCPRIAQLVETMLLEPGSRSHVSKMIRALEDQHLITRFKYRTSSIQLTHIGLQRVGADITLCPACGHMFK